MRLGITKFKEYIKKTPLVYIYILFKNLSNKKTSQSNEAEIIDNLNNEFNIPKSFIEFGFSGWEFNCIDLAKSSDFEGLIIDGNSYNVTIAKQIFHKKIFSKQLWITLESLDFVIDYSRDKDIGILSIDVDGNDYWFLEKLISINPALIIVEINVSFTHRPITVPYDSNFDRRQKHESWEYYGASLSALNYLCENNNYSLVEISQNGVNAFFIRDDLFLNNEKKLSIDKVELKKLYPDGSIAPTSEFWEGIKHLPYVDVVEKNKTMLLEK